MRENSKTPSTYRQLSRDHRRYAQLADLPAFERLSALFPVSQTNTLNNGDRRCTLGADAVPDFFLLSGPASFLPRLPNPGTIAYGIQSTNAHRRAYQLRDFMDHVLASAGVGKTTKKIMTFVDAFKVKAADVFDIQDNSFNTFRRHNFIRCGSSRTRGRVGKKAGKVRDHRRFRCSEPCCPMCRDQERKKYAAEVFEEIKRLERSQGGKEITLLDTVFTLPASVESWPIENPEFQKTLLAEIHGIMRRLFGLNSRDNLGLYLAVHPIGDTDLLRDRWHVHVLIVPGYVHRGKGGHEFRLVDPVRVSDRHGPERWSIDLEWLRQEWESVVYRVFGSAAGAPIIPHVTILGRSRAYYPKGDVDKRFEAQLFHKIKYMFRAFWKDFLNSYLRMELATKNVILKAKNSEQNGWQVLPLEDVVARYKKIKEKNKIGRRGFLQCLEKYKDVIGLENPPAEVPEDPDMVWIDAEVEIVKRKVFDPKTFTFRMVEDEIWSYQDPDTGEMCRYSLMDFKRHGG